MFDLLLLLFLCSYYINFFKFIISNTHILLTTYSYISCPEVDDHDDSDSTSITIPNSENCLKHISLSSKHKRMTGNYSFHNKYVLSKNNSTSKRTTNTLTNNIDDSDDEDDEFQGLGVGMKLTKVRSAAPRLSLKFEEDCYDPKIINYSLDCTNYKSSFDTRKKSVEMQLEPNLFSKNKVKKVYYNSSNKMSLTSITSPEFNRKLNKLKKSQITSKFSITEEEEFSLQPTKHQSCNLEGFQINAIRSKNNNTTATTASTNITNNDICSRFNKVIADFSKLNNSAKARKGSSILAKLVNGVNNRKYTYQLKHLDFKNEDIKEEDDELFKL